jgi:methionine-rich copper-binding protein CopC
MKLKSVVVAAFLAVSASAFAQQSVWFVEPADGATVSSPFKVKFAVSGMEVKPAGDMTANTGHHHLLINATPVKAGEVIPADETHIHFGKGQTETEVKLAPGTYTLSMQFANGLHQSYGPGMSKSIKVTVK